MKRKKTLVLCLIAVLLASIAITNPTASSPKPTLYIAPSAITPETHDPDDIKPGKKITVDVNISNVEDLWGWGAYVLFNPNVLQVANLWTDITFTTWLRDNAQPSGVFVYAKKRRSNTQGWLFVGQMLNVTATEGATTIGNATLASITFTIVGRGVTDLDFPPLQTQLSTVVAGIPVLIDHDAEDGFFDNRVEKKPPHALFTGPSFGIENYEVTFDASASHDNDDGGWIVSYEWDFGDGTSEIYVEGVNLTTTAKHTYTSRGTYPVTLTVTDNDDLTNTVGYDLPILTWMEAGTFPDLVGWEAKPEFPRLDEVPGARGLDLRSLVGNPTDDTYEVYVEFTLISKDEGKVLGTLTTETESIGPGNKTELRAYFNTMDPMWRCFSGSPEWVTYGYYHWFFHKYIGFASCYYWNGTDFIKGNVAKYLSFNVAVWYTHDIAILDITTSSGEVMRGGTIEEINVTVANNGELSEGPVPLTVYYVGPGGVTGPIGEVPIALDPGENTTETFTWNTGCLRPNPYLIIAELPFLAYEGTAYIGDNSDSVKIFVTRLTHDVGVLGVEPLNETVNAGETALIEVEVANEGNSTETFDVKAYANTTLIDTKTVTALASGAKTTLIFEWDTTSFSSGNYTITAEAIAVAGETFTCDNSYTDGVIEVKEA